MNAHCLYLAGPMTGIQEHNTPAFDLAAAQLRALGYDVVSPPDITRANPVDGVGADGSIAPAAYAALVRLDLAALLMAAKGTGTAFHFKQYGAYRPVMQIHADDQEERLDAIDPARLVCVDYSGKVWINNDTRTDGQPPSDAWYMEYVGKRDVGREFDGNVWDEYPEARA